MVFHILQLLYHLDFFSTIFAIWNDENFQILTIVGEERNLAWKQQITERSEGHCSGERIWWHVLRERELVLCVGYRSNSTRSYLQKDVYAAWVVCAAISVLSLYFWGQGRSPALTEEIMGSRWRAGDVRIPGYASEFGVYVAVLAWNWCSRKLLSLFLLVRCS